MHDVTTFQYQSHEFRSVQDGEELYFVAKDVCQALELSDVSMACQNLPEDEKLVQALLVSGQARKMLCVTESGLYRLIFRSNKPEAEKFRRWVFHEVLPVIRKTGSYSMVSGGGPDILQQILDKQIQIEQRLDRFRPSMSAIGNVLDFVNKCCDHGFHMVTDKTTLYRAYEDYCRQTGQVVSCRAHFFMKLYRTDKAYSSTMTRFGRRIKAVRGLQIKGSAVLASPQRSLFPEDN